MSESNQVKILVAPESPVAYGVAPPAGVFETLRWTGASLNTANNTVTSAEVRSDRMTSDAPKVSTTVSGGIDFEFSAGTYDAFLEATMCGTWTTDVLKVGTIDRSFTFEEQFGDLTDKFIVFKGMRATSADMAISHGSLVTGSFQFAGNGYERPVSTITSGGTVNPISTTEVMNASTDIGTIEFDGVASSLCFSSMNISIDNGMREINCVGYDAPRNQAKGTSNITGSIEFYLSDDAFAIYDKMLDNDSMSFSYVVSDGVNSYTFLVPNAKLSGDAPAPSGLDSDIMLTVNFTALYDVTENSSLVITRA